VNRWSRRASLGSRELALIGFRLVPHSRSRTRSSPVARCHFYPLGKKLRSRTRLRAGRKPIRWKIATYHAGNRTLCLAPGAARNS
jgi:hypothetical protein